MVRILNLYQTKIPMAQQSTHVLPAIEHLTGLVAEAGSPFLASAKPLGVKQSWQSTWFWWAVWQIVLWQSLSRIYIYIYLFISSKHFQLDIILKIYMRMSENHRRYHFQLAHRLAAMVEDWEHWETAWHRTLGIVWFSGKATPTALHNIQCWWWWCDCNWMLSTHVIAEQNLLEQNHDSTMPKLVAIIPQIYCILQ